MQDQTVTETTERTAPQPQECKLSLMSARIFKLTFHLKTPAHISKETRLKSKLIIVIVGFTIT